MNRKQKQEWINYRNDLDFKYLGGLNPDIQGYLGALQGEGTLEKPFVVPVQEKLLHKMIYYPFGNYKLLQNVIFYDPINERKYFYYLGQSYLQDPRSKVIQVVLLKENEKPIIDTSWDYTYTQHIYSKEELKELRQKKKENMTKLNAELEASRLKAYANAKPTWLDDNADNVVDAVQMLMIFVIILAAAATCVGCLYLGCTETIGMLIVPLMLGGLFYFFYVGMKREDEQLKRGRQEPKQPKL